MRIIIKNTFIIALVFVLFSCEKTIEFDKDDIKPKIVVNAVAIAGQGIVAKVEKSRSVLFRDNYFEAIPDAKVLLYENGTFLKQLEYKSVIDTFRKYLEYGVEKKIHFENGNYFDTSVKIKEGATYKLEVTRDGFDPVWCETTVPKPVDISDFTIAYEKVKVDDYGMDYQINMSLKINDRVSEDNFYSLDSYVTYGIELGYLRSAVNNGYGGGGSYGNQGSPQPFSQTDTIVEQSNYYSNSWYSSDPMFNEGDAMEVFDDYIYSNGLFTDELINGKNYTFTFASRGNFEIHTDVGEYVQVYISIDNLSKGLYLYFRSREEHAYAKDDPFAEPVPVYSNVVGGLGIFGSRSNSFIDGFFGEFPVDGKTYIDEQTYREMQNSGRYESQ